MENKNYKKMLSRLDFLIEDKQDHSEKFIEYYREYIKEFPEKAPPPKPPEFFEDEEESLTPEESKILKKLFRQISKLTHPDKVKSDYLEKIFIEANDAYKNKDVALLFSIAVKIDAIPKEVEMSVITNKIEEKIKELENSIDTYVNSLPWKWATAKTPEEKAMVKMMIDGFVAF